MDNFKDYLDEREDIKYEEELNEMADAGLTAAALILGIPTVGLLAAYGGSLVAYAYVKGASGIVNIWRKIGEVFKELRGKRAAEYISRVRRDPLVKQEISKAISSKREYDDVLKELYDAIEKKDFITLKEKYDALTPAFRNMPAVKQIIINEVTKSLGEPPLWPPSPGNKTYKAIRNVLGLQEAKAAARAVVYNANKTMNVSSEPEEKEE
jgi:hypothetical protein